MVQLMDSNYEIRTEDKLILLCMRNKLDPEIKKNICSLFNEDLDWDYLIQTATKNKLRAFLYCRLKNVCPETVPEKVMTSLKDYFLNNTQRNMLLVRELLRILKEFESHEIFALSYKGPSLAIMAYGDLSLREFGDIDIYVNLGDIVRVETIMRSLGYEPLFKLTKCQKSAYYKFQREFKFVNRYNNVLVEIKWKYVVPSFSFNTNPNNLFNSDTYSVEIANSKVKTISPENLLLLLCIHNASHYWPLLSWICDISHLINSQKSFNWSLVLDNAEILGIKRILYINLSLAVILFGLELPTYLSAQFERDRKKEAIAEKIIKVLFIRGGKNNGTDKVYLRYKIRENRHNKIKDLVKMMFIPTTEVITSISFPFFLNSFYYILRIVQLFKNYVFKR